MLPNSAAFVASFLGIARLGAVVAPLSPRYRQQELTYFLNDLEPVAVVSDDQSLEVLGSIVPGLPCTPALVDVSDRTGAGAAHVVRNGAGEARPLPATDSPSLLQLYTSGSVGVPKRVVRTHAAVLKELGALKEAFGVDERDRFLGAAPFAHVNGLVRTMLTSMFVGAELYPVSEFRRRESLDIMTRERITFLGAVPQIIALLGQTPVRGNVDLSALRVVFSSSAPLVAADNRQFQEKYGIYVRQLYGSSETGTISFNRHPQPETCLESVGTPINSVSVGVVDEHGNRMPPGQEGEIVITSPFAASEYVGNATATAESFRDGLYFSGDVGTIDASGFVRLTGRKKLFINRGGFKVNPYEIESAIREHPKVVEVAVFGAPGPHGDDLVCAAIVASAACTSGEILSHCQSRIADFKLPNRIEFRQSLPKSQAGKVLRSELLAELGAPAARSEAEGRKS
jgi:long-chain acyl-CoA synthetase